MNLQRKNAHMYIIRVMLVFIPFLVSYWEFWNWLTELLLILAVFIHHRTSSLRLTVFLLAAGYAVSSILLGWSSFWSLGLSPWAAVLFLLLIDKGYCTAVGMLCSLLFVALLDALQVVPAMRLLLQPQNLETAIAAIVKEMSNQPGLMDTFFEQGFTISELENSLRFAMPVYFQLMPGFAGAFGMMKLGTGYLIFNSFFNYGHKIRHFSLWQFPWYTVWVMIGGIIAYLAGDYFGWSNIKITGMNIMLVMGLISLVLGCSVTIFILKYANSSRLYIWLFVVLGIFLPFILLIGIGIIGLFDLVLNFRRIPVIEGGKDSEDNS